MQLVHAPHQLQILVGGRSRLVVDRAAGDAERFRLAGDRKLVIAIDHRFALSRPALLSAPDKKSLVRVSSPILACSAFKSTAASFASGFS